MRFVMCMCRKTAVKISDDANYTFGHTCTYAGKVAVWITSDANYPCDHVSIQDNSCMNLRWRYITIQLVMCTRRKRAVWLADDAITMRFVMGICRKRGYESQMTCGHVYMQENSCTTGRWRKLCVWSYACRKTAVWMAITSFNSLMLLIVYQPSLNYDSLIIIITIIHKFSIALFPAERAQRACSHTCA